MSILDELAAHARERVLADIENMSLDILQAMCRKKGRANGARFYDALKKDDLSFICEVKKASPSKGVIARDFPYLDIARDYEAAGADCISCLTEPKWFLGSDNIFREIRAAVSTPMLRKDFKTASSIMFLLGIGEILEEWTHKKSVDDLARTMSLNVDQAWVRRGGQEILLPLKTVEMGDEIVVRTGGMIPLDGRVVDGEATVNQASITGESMPVRKAAGSYAYAGTVVEEGECVIRVEKASGSGRYDKIVEMIEASEKMKSATEDKASHLADKLVPYSLGGTILTYLLTRNVTKALSILMVDFSCALKLSMPLAVLSAMRESSLYHITVKGGKFLEAVSQANTIVFDKTGTLTYACPRVKMVVPFDGKDENEMLRLAACLEEHYPHSMANAVVDEAKNRNLNHEERHSKVEYVVAHGISSRVEDEKVVIGSHHFVFEDEGCVIPAGEQEKFDNLPAQYSHLYLAVGGVLAAVICVEDPLRAEACSVVSKLKELGIDKIVMMTGDSYRTAKSVAADVGVTEFHAEVLPEDKAAFVRAEHEKGRKVIMIGDGVNDSPALSEADAGCLVLSTDVAGYLLSKQRKH
mgnify:CR=1 FL=1